MTNFPTRKLQRVQTTPPAKPPSQILPRFRCISASVSRCSLNGAVYTCSGERQTKTAQRSCPNLGHYPRRARGGQPPGPFDFAQGRRRHVRYSRRIMKFAPVLLVMLVMCGGDAVSCATDFRYFREGNPHDLQTRAD